MDNSKFKVSTTKYPADSSSKFHPFPALSESKAPWEAAAVPKGLSSNDFEAWYASCTSCAAISDTGNVAIWLITSTALSLKTWECL
jgi:hypothetical protein